MKMSDKGWQYLNSTDQQRLECKMEKYPDKVDALLAKANKKGQKIYRRWKKCRQVYDSLPKATTPEQEWFMDQMEASLERSHDDFMDLNCDAFEMGLKLMKEHNQIEK